MLLSLQSGISSMVMSRSGLSLEELRIVEGQGQSTDVVTPSEEMNRFNEYGKAFTASPTKFTNCLPLASN